MNIHAGIIPASLAADNGDPRTQTGMTDSNGPAAPAPATNVPAESKPNRMPIVLPRKLGKPTAVTSIAVLITGLAIVIGVVGYTLLPLLGVALMRRRTSPNRKMDYAITTVPQPLRLVLQPEYRLVRGLDGNLRFANEKPDTAPPDILDAVPRGLNYATGHGRATAGVVDFLVIVEVEAFVDSIGMVKAVNINLVICLAALIISIDTASVWDGHDIVEVTGKMMNQASSVVSYRREALAKLSFGRWPADVETYIVSQIAEAVANSVPSLPPFKDQQLFQEPNKFMPRRQLEFTRAYHSLAFEKLKTLFLKIQLCMTQQQNLEILQTGLDCIAPYLLMHQDLERKWRKRLYDVCPDKGQVRNVIERWRKLELPEYDWDPVHNNLLRNLQNRLAQGQSSIYNDINTEGMLESFWMRILYAVRGGEEEVFRGLPFQSTRLFGLGAICGLADCSDKDRLDELAPVDSMQSPPEDQNYAYNYEPISDHGPGCGLEASTSQPRPQPVFFDFLGVEDTTREATPELAPRWGHSHDDRDPHTDNRFGNEQHRPPSGHVGFVGGSGMHPDTPTGNIKRPCDSSLHGQTSTSNIGVADSPRPYTRFKMSGEYLDPT
ncbi:hypothetical protein SeMB42_g06844 [Synchytrium endobioticum]|uniref:Uncharacterized protein n=2 Tax=Synchytrium endobioticum TaxID=286115 RepID=A0A507CIB0_9FUNG|nr:hypothetical protein SeMB42_g06844 [Synchytrium endobioticum]